MRRWKVAGGLLSDERGLLLVANRRRNGSVDWTTPGGVIDDGESALVALSREVTEETGLVAVGWNELCWTVEVDFIDLDMHLHVEVHRAAGWSGDLAFDDPDGIVYDGGFHDHGGVAERLVGATRWVAEPLQVWLAGNGDDRPHFQYRATGSLGELRAERLEP
ncbi:MAG: NUDIX hydrolase [Acidimicrobiales bacterium]|nr:NUDIX hydrolase [Acidimicrobiales bacterium]MDG1878157.1 NUDIX hydrolase [Acidimicrobiales bacterium]